MSWKFNPFTSKLDYYQDDFKVTSYGADTVLTTADLKQIHIMDVSGGDLQFTLPSVTASEVGQWIILAKSGVNKLTLQASGTDVILNSSAGGYIICDDATHDYSSLYLIVMESGLWGTPSFGIWSTY